MNSVMDFFFSLLKFLGLLEEPPLLRKNFKRNRVYDDFSSDDETPVLGYQQVKRCRRSGIIATIDYRDKEGKSYPVRNVPVQIKGSYTTSTPKESPKRMVPVNLSGISRNGPSSPQNETNTKENLEHEEPTVAWVESKLENTKKESSMLHVDLDDDDSDNNQQGDDVVFVKEVTRPPEHVFATNSHAIALNDEVISKVLEKIASEENLEYQELLRRIANTIKPMSKEKPIVDGKLAEDSASFKLPKSTQINILNEIKLDNELNADTYQNAPQDQGPIRVSSTDSSDSDDDVELVPLESSTTSSMRKDSNRNIAELSRNWLLELNSEYNNKLPINQAKINNSRRVSKVNSDQTLARPHRNDKTDTSEGRHHHHLLLGLDSKYNYKQPHNKSVIQITQEKSNDSRRASVITPNGNSEQNEARSSSSDAINDWLAKLNAKYFSTPLQRKTPEKFNDVQKSEAEPCKLDIAGAGLSRLESKNKTSLLKSHETHNDAPQEPKIVSKEHTVQNEAKLGTTREWLAKLEAEYFSTPTKPQENLNNARQVSNIVPKVNEQNDVRSYLPAASRDWLLELDAKYNTTPQKNQENLNNARQELNNVPKVNGEDRSLKLDSTDDWLVELKSRYSALQHKRQEELNDASRESVIVTELNSNQNESVSHEPDNARETISKSDSKFKTEQPKMQEKLNNSHQELNSDQNKVRSLKFNSSEDLMLKLGSLYNKCQQETQEQRRKSLLNPNEIKQVNHEQKRELSKSNTEESDVEMQSNVDLPALTPEQEMLVDGALEPEPEEELLVERFNLRIHRRDLQTLSDLNWLNDEVINFYMNLIMQRSEERKDLPKVYATNTFFYPKLVQSGQAGLRRWTRKVDIFAYDLFVVPVNIGHHWCLSIVDFRERIVNYLDSRGRPNQECLDALLQYLKDEHQDKRGAPFDVSRWKTECVTDIPQQMNGSDCGMFACTFAEFSSRGAAYSFTQAHMPYLRRKAALEILMGKLLL